MKVFNAEEAADYLSVNPWQIRKYIRQGLLPRNYLEIKHLIHLVFYLKDLKEFFKGEGMNNGKPLTTKEAAEFLNTSEDNIRDFLKQGKLKGYKLGNGTNKKGSRRRWRVWKDDLITFLEKGSNIKDGE